MVFDSILNPVFLPILRLPALAAIAFVSFLISLLITIVYKYMTNQTMMKDLKTRQKEFQKKMKENRGEPDKVMKIQKQAMEVNMKYMTQSFKPTLITFLPIIIIFTWLNAHLGFEPIMPDEEFLATLTFEPGISGVVEVLVPEEVDILGSNMVDITEGVVEFSFKADKGDYLLSFNHGDNSYSKEVRITEERLYADVEKIVEDGSLKNIKLSNDKLIALNIAGSAEGGWKKGRLGWLGTYIIFSILFSLGLRKLMKIY